MLAERMHELFLLYARNNITCLVGRGIRLDGQALICQMFTEERRVLGIRRNCQCMRTTALIGDLRSCEK